MEPMDHQEGLLQEILFEAYVDCQRDCETSGKIPRDDTSALVRFRPEFEFVGAIQFGILIASLTTLLIFVVTRMVLHFDITWF